MSPATLLVLLSFFLTVSAMSVAFKDAGFPMFIIESAPRRSIPVVELVEKPNPWGAFFAFRPQTRQFVKQRQPESRATICQQERQLAALGLIPDVVSPNCGPKGGYAVLQYSGYPSFCQHCVNPLSNRPTPCPESMRAAENLEAPICDWAFKISAPSRTRRMRY